MNKKKLLLLGLGILINVFLGQSENIKLKTKFSREKDTMQSQIPVTADINGSELGIHFQKVSDAFITIEGPEGVIYHRSTNVEETQSIYVDLTPYQEGEYTIYYHDTKGNELEGDFQKTESE